MHILPTICLSARVCRAYEDGGESELLSFSWMSQFLPWLCLRHGDVKCKVLQCSLFLASSLDKRNFLKQAVSKDEIQEEQEGKNATNYDTQPCLTWPFKTVSLIFISNSASNGGRQSKAILWGRHQKSIKLSYNQVQYCTHTSCGKSLQVKFMESRLKFSKEQ